MSSCAIEPFCHGVEGQTLIHLCRIGLHRAYEFGPFQSRVRRAQHQLQRQGRSQTSQMLRPAGGARSCCTGGAQLSAADPQASCKAPICLRDAAPSAPAPALPFSAGYQATPQLQTRLVLPDTAWRHPSLLLLLEGREHDFGGRWEEGGHK